MYGTLNLKSYFEYCTSALSFLPEINAISGGNDLFWSEVLG